MGKREKIINFRVNAEESKRIRDKKKEYESVSAFIRRIIDEY